MDRLDRLTDNFLAGEFMHSDMAQRNGIVFPVPNGAIESNIRSMAKKAQEFRDILGVKVMVNNGWRPTLINNLVGGSSTSAHLEALAADLVPSGMVLSEALSILTSHPEFMEDVDQIIIERGCIHVGLPCKASGYRARHEVRSETYTTDRITGKSSRHYPLMFVWGE